LGPESHVLSFVLSRCGREEKVAVLSCGGRKEKKGFGSQFHPKGEYSLHVNTGKKKKGVDAYAEKKGRKGGGNSSDTR